MNKTNKPSESTKFIYLLVLFMTLFPDNVSAQPVEKTKNLTCYISAEPVQQTRKGIWLNFYVVNPSDHDVKLLTWHTPLEGFLSDLFLIENNKGKAVRYKGKMVKRGQPTADDYVTLAKGSSILKQINLLDGYPLYRIDYFTVSLKKPVITTADNQIACQSQKVTISLN